MHGASSHRLQSRSEIPGGMVMRCTGNPCSMIFSIGLTSLPAFRTAKTLPGVMVGNFPSLRTPALVTVCDKSATRSGCGCNEARKVQASRSLGRCRKRSSGEHALFQQDLLASTGCSEACKARHLGLVFLSGNPSAFACESGSLVCKCKALQACPRNAISRLYFIERCYQL